ncbi:FecR family protein [Filimonas lacunae]|uniref:FecR family protein n=1 Tax=Filimonas lacunae TaxID=477680 RepID=A0A173ML64_9BACT|nr:FecR domain-containing protein [Filimonas lacunae]BAV08227.1 anti-sigma factor [Filimonas lacunae]SIT33097.1 FecR family protein [Filimonas lacunae]
MEKFHRASSIKREKVPLADFNTIFVRYLNNNCSPEETAFLMEQLASGELTEEQQQLLEQHITNWTALQQNGEPIPATLQNKLDNIKKLVDTEVIRQTQPAKQVKLSWRTYAAAAAVTGLVVVGYWGFKNLSPIVEKTKTFAAQPGERRSLRLPDGSQVILNGESNLVLSENFTTGNREVTLSGEAYFDVSQNAAHPFIIHTMTMDIEVLGTAFNVRSYPDEAAEETSLIRGKVQVTLKKEGESGKSYILLPMQKLVVAKSRQGDSANNHTVSSPTPHVDSLFKNRLLNNLPETAWTENKLAFDNATLETVADKMEKWYGITVEIKNDAIKNIPYTGSFEGETLEKVMDAIKYSIPMLHYKMEGSRKLILY